MPILSAFMLVIFLTASGKRQHMELPDVASEDARERAVVARDADAIGLSGRQD